MSRPPVEPSAEMRVAAHAMREMYLALLEQGFTEHQVYRIIAAVLRDQQQEGQA